MVFRSASNSSHPVCTVRRHPDGGFTPVLHLSDQPVPSASADELSMPTPEDVIRYARNHYGTRVVLVDPECRSVDAA